MEPANTSSIFDALSYFFEIHIILRKVQGMEHRYPVPVSGIPAEAQLLQQSGSIPESGTGLSGAMGIGADGDDFTAALPVELQNRSPFSDGTTLGGVALNAFSFLHQNLE